MLCTYCPSPQLTQLSKSTHSSYSGNCTWEKCIDKTSTYNSLATPPVSINRHPVLMPGMSLPLLFICSQSSDTIMMFVGLTLWVFSLLYQFDKLSCDYLFLFLTYFLMLICLSFFLSFKTISFYMLFEMSIPPTLFLIMLYGYQPEKMSASSYLVLYTVLSSLPMLMVILTLPPYLSHLSSTSSGMVTFALTAGFMVKTPLYLLHIWLPKAHVEAPVAGSMILAGILLKLGSYGLLLFLPLFSHKLLSMYLFISVVGGVICCFTCTRQWDSKSVIAYSSVVHMGVVNVGFISGSEMGYFSAVMMVVAHGVCSPLLFSIAFIMYSNSHTRLLFLNRGCLSTPMFCFFLFGLLSVNMGVPPFLNVWSEVLMLTALCYIMVWCMPFILTSCFCVVLYNIVMYIMLTHGKEGRSVFMYAPPWPFVSSLFLSLALSFNISMFAP